MGLDQGEYHHLRRSGPPGSKATSLAWKQKEGRPGRRGGAIDGRALREALSYIYDGLRALVKADQARALAQRSSQERDSEMPGSAEAGTIHATVLAAAILTTLSPAAEAQEPGRTRLNGIKLGAPVDSVLDIIHESCGEQVGSGHSTPGSADRSVRETDIANSESGFRRRSVAEQLSMCDKDYRSSGFPFPRARLSIGKLSLLSATVTGKDGMVAGMRLELRPMDYDEILAALRVSYGPPSVLEPSAAYMEPVIWRRRDAEISLLRRRYARWLRSDVTSILA